MKARGVLLAATFAGGCVGVIGISDGDESAGGPTGPGTTEAVFAPAPATLHRLTEAQLHNSYRHLFGEPVPLPRLPSDDQLYGLSSISAASQTVSPLDAELYEAATYEVLDAVWADAVRREALVGCVPASAADPCLRAFVASFGQRAWRRPLAQTEVDALVALGAELSTSLGDVWAGMRFLAAAVLQSPHFLFRVEVGAPDASGLLRYSGWEMASRLAFLITDSPPDDTLLEAAAAGELDDDDGLRTHAERLLDDPRARRALVRFFRDFMNIGRLDELDKSAEVFPMFTATLGPAMRIEIERMFEHTVFDTEGDFRALFTTRETFIEAELAALYGIGGVSGGAHVPVTLPAGGPRAGLLTTAGFLAMNAHKTSTSPTHRGRFVRINLLCEDVAPPPEGVDTTLPAPDPDAAPQTLRERLSKHREDDACRSCHVLMDPIGFGLEHFDAIGAHRLLDNGLPVDATSDLDGTPFEGGVELGELVAALPEVSRCVARRFYQHATGHLDGKGEVPAVDELVEGFVGSDFNFRQLVVQMVLNRGYRFAASQPPGESAPAGGQEAGDE